MPITHYMQIFEISAIALGFLTGFFAALFPNVYGEKRPLAAIIAFSISLGLLVTILPIVLVGKQFATILAVSLVASLVGFIASRELACEQRISSTNSKLYKASGSVQPASSVNFN